MWAVGKEIREYFDCRAVLFMKLQVKEGDKLGKFEMLAFGDECPGWMAIIHKFYPQVGELKKCYTPSTGLTGTFFQLRIKYAKFSNMVVNGCSSIEKLQNFVLPGFWIRSSFH